MNILVISENFYTGGLERQILTQKETLPKEQFIYLFTNYKENRQLENNMVYSLTGDRTIGGFIENVEKITEIIKKERIDYIHAHPFHTLFPALFASFMTNTPICYTVHGYASINFPYNINDSILIRYMLNCLDNPLFAVSHQYKEVLDTSFNRKNVYYLPNCLKASAFKECNFTKGGKWALISRLDKDKEKEITLIIENLDKLGIKKLDIIGTGDSLEHLSELAKNKNVDFLGYHSNINDILSNGYTGVVGLGQVVLEGLFSNLPVLLIGDGRITGLVDKDMYTKIKNYNFVNRFIEDEPLEDIARSIKNLEKNISNYQLRNEVIEEFSSSVVYASYLETLKTSKQSAINYFEKIFDEIKGSLDNKTLSKDEDFYSSRTVYNILKKYLKGYTLNQNLLDCFNYWDLKLEVIDRDNETVGQIYRIKEELQKEYKEEIHNLREQNEKLTNDLEKTKKELNDFKYKTNEFMNKKIFRTYRTIKGVFKRKKGD